ncbi:MAG: ABC transporter permease subunit [Lachnospiraceae bacterium]|nr:ABC transporter permease subunit [Lachnospiraceae bacterium]
MTLIKHELKRGKISLIVWTASIGLLMAICIFLYPEMKGDMEGVTEMFSSMGSFTEAFGMDRLNFGTLIGFYGVECGNILGLGGAFFAAITAIGMLSKEEKDRTAEFLLTHPVTRIRIITEKLCAVFFQVLLLNIIVFTLSIGSIAAIKEEIPWKELLLMHSAYLLLQIELSGICFGISAFLRQSGLSIGLGLTVVMYFLNLTANITSSASFLKYITPFSYVESADILSDGSLNASYILAGMFFTVAGIVAAYLKYNRKDIH